MSPSHPAPKALAALIDSTLLRPDAREQEIRTLAQEALRYGFAAVCVQPYWTPLAAEELHGSPVRLCTVVAFPHGALDPDMKAQEARALARAGATELDMVVNLGALKSGDWRVVQHELEMVVSAASACSASVKVILECALLAEDEKRRAAELCAQAGAAFVKTSTGFAGGGATTADVRLLSGVAAGRCGVKAAGGIRDLDAALAMLKAGATRLGTSAGAHIVEEARERSVDASTS